MFVDSQKLTVAVIVWAVTLTTTNADTTVNSNEKTLGSELGSVSEPTTEVSDGITWSGTDGMLGARYNSKPYLIFCCEPMKQARYQGKCIQDEYASSATAITIGNYTWSEKDDNSKVIDINNYCGFLWMAAFILEKFYVSSDFSIYSPDYGESLSNFEHYCLFREPRSTDFVVKVCRMWIKRSWWESVCVVYSISVMFAVFISYTVIPELRNLNGTIFRSYIGTYIGLYFFALLGSNLVGRSDVIWMFRIAICGLIYCAAGCAFWLNVMSMNIMRTFNQLLPVNSRTRTSARKRFIRYAIYAWGFPALSVLSFAFAVLWDPYLQTDTHGQTLIFTSSIVGLIFFLTINVLMFARTAWKIRCHNADNTKILDMNAERRNAAKRWFTLNVKLFLIMGGHIPVWLFWVIWISPIATHILAAFEVFQSSMIFYVFIWKDDVKRLFREQFYTFLTGYELTRVGMPKRLRLPVNNVSTVGLSTSSEK